MRKPVVILLLLCFLLQAGGLWLLLHSRQMALKREMKAKLKADPTQFEQTVFEFDLKDGEPIAQSFEWEEEGEEFRYQGSMYDVIEREVTGNILRLRCIDDKKEADLIRKMEELQRNEPGRHKTALVPLQQLLSILLFSQHNYTDAINISSPLHHIDRYTRSCNTIILDILAPPPR